MIKNFIKAIVELFPYSARITPWGFSLAGHAAMAAGSFEPEETKVVRKLLADVDVLVNVGANVGYYCCHALSMGKSVIAVEPNTRNLHYLLKNIKNNGWEKKAEVFPVAMGSGTDILPMWGGGTGASLIKGWAATPERYVTQVPVLSLDRVLGDTLRGKSALILVDVEGAEWMMLQGAKRALMNEPRPIWMMEICFAEHQPAGVAMNPHFKETFGIFFECGYRAFTADSTALEITPAMVDEVVVGHRKLETHNFIFR
ncbi:FkbM family methyltransferase [Thermosynechococcus sp. PP45]|uniref:FkbM family methyltransferase n=1 Tax=unclassified Thermosynechococcus TaxID=2622553 RepID=UPI0026713B04|nr:MULTISPECIES: FkbM family methyltransferase [unclassified Thermosynechococcus]WKT80104.1 FkbM family methyltransferase [Thermosynechococcus sp. PP45]WNC23714.1 FkbM family methyltransferase [Thermosynechococcus sp. PP551]WNC26290.1 FkbM family methyltransferase [Thermosynechococcus sp. PP555]